mmetsp:Transcript_15896/g.26794  ORF Transcript_15896/g.26794 Transcript_15896/m.26794 type:complete len:86 (+) Transcript_15896:200-457(+)
MLDQGLHLRTFESVLDHKQKELAEEMSADEFKGLQKMKYQELIRQLTELSISCNCEELMAELLKHDLKYSNGLQITRLMQLRNLK